MMAYLLPDEAFGEIDNVRLQLEAFAALTYDGSGVATKDVPVNREALGTVFCQVAKQLHNILDGLEYHRLALPQ